MNGYQQQIKFTLNSGTNGLTTQISLPYARTADILVNENAIFYRYVLFPFLEQYNHF